MKAGKYQISSFIFKNFSPPRLHSNSNGSVKSRRNPNLVIPVKIGRLGQLRFFVAKKVLQLDKILVSPQNPKSP
jgi:hypothetical protein